MSNKSISTASKKTITPTKSDQKIRGNLRILENEFVTPKCMCFQKIRPFFSFIEFTIVLDVNSDSLSDIGQDVNKLKTDMDKKTSSIITGFQSLYDKINATPGLVGKTVKQIIDDKLNKDQTLINENSTRQNNTDSL